MQRPNLYGIRVAARVCVCHWAKFLHNASLWIVSALALPATALAEEPAAKPPEQSVAPSSSAPATTPSGGSANGALDVCAELVAFLVQTHQMQAAGGSQVTPDAPNQNAASPGADTRPVPGQTTPNIDKPQQQSGQTAPLPPAQEAAKPPVMTLEDARGMARRGDERGCRDAAQKMRRAGMTMPDSSIVFAALRPELLGPQPPAR